MGESMRGVMMTDRGPWTSTYSGGRFYPLDPSIEDIELIDIAAALSKLCRFNGHCERFYSVAEHSVRLSRMFRDPAKARWGLMHDAAEAYIGDIVRPLKRSLKGISHIEDRILLCVAHKFNLPPTIYDAVHEADERMCSTEKRDLFVRAEDWPDMLPPYEWKLPMREVGPDESMRWFLHRFKELWPENRGV